MILEDYYFVVIFLAPSVHPYFYPSTMGFTHPNDGVDGSLHKAINIPHQNIKFILLQHWIKIKYYMYLYYY